ncbi:MAG: esterase [Chloroflexi bacterium]|nr:esterase [Chloroflexota bacterium]
MNHKSMSIFLLMTLALSVLSGCAAPSTTAPTAVASSTAATTTEGNPMDPAKDDAYAEALTFDNSAWNYDADNDVYWQIGVQYAATPETTDYETLGIYVPGAYMTATANGDGTYTAAINEAGTLNGFTAKTAPIVFPVNTGGYAAQKAPTAYSYDGLSSYLSAGFIYVYAGARGKENGYDAGGNLTYSGGAPWGVTDFKAAIRYVRYNKDILPGSTDSIFVFGMSGGGAQSTLIGATGDSELYFPYLESIQAAMYDADGQYISDAVNGVMAWCPITSLDYANEAYEWNMGQYSTEGTRADSTFTSALSKDLATAYAEYINALGIQDENGNVLTLEQSDAGIYASGNYHNYLMKTIETSLNNFLADTTFPYTETAGGFPGGFPDGGFAGGAPDGGLPEGGTPPAGMMPGGDNSSADATATTYQTVQEYIDALNQDGQWVTYDAATNTAKVTSLAGFVNSQKDPSKNVGAFDALDRSTAENSVFGNEANDFLHFDSVLANLLSANQAAYAAYPDWDAAYVDAYAADLLALDKFGNSIQYRLNAYNPMYYLLPYYAGYQTAAVAPHWRIRTGIMQGDTATTVEMNLALALENYSGVESVDFATVWGQAHTKAERSGDSTANFIAWVIEVTQK